LELLALFFGASNAGLSVLLLNPALPAEELKFYIQDVSARVLTNNFDVIYSQAVVVLDTIEDNPAIQAAKELSVPVWKIRREEKTVKLLRPEIGDGQYQVS
jgi:acyl-CoA synthetase (AMP-forming)/AMP-acid ligase II